MNTEEILKTKKELEEELEKFHLNVTEETFDNATKEEKEKYLQLMTEIKFKLQILNNL